MKNILKTYPVVSTLTFICLFLGILTSIYGDPMYDLLAFHSQPVYDWQYISGTLMHGSKGAPLWFLWLHLSGIASYLLVFSSANTLRKNASVIR